MIQPADPNDARKQRLEKLQSQKAQSSYGQPHHNPPAEGKYDTKTGVVSFQTAPAQIAQILSRSGAMKILNIKPNARVGFKLEGGKAVARYNGLLDSLFIQGIQETLNYNNIDQNKTNIMSAFVTHNGRDTYIASVLILPNRQNVICGNPALNSIQDQLDPLMTTAGSIYSQVCSSALRLKRPDLQRDGIYFYKLNNLGPEYQPLVDYMHDFQKTDPKTSKAIYLGIREFPARDLPPDLRQTNDQTIITAVSLTSDINKLVAPVLMFTNTARPVAYSTEDFKDFIAKQNNTTEEQAANLARLLFNEYAAAT